MYLNWSPQHGPISHLGLVIWGGWPIDYNSQLSDPSF